MPRFEPAVWARGPVRGQLWTRRDGETPGEFAWFLRYLTRPNHQRHPNHIAAELDREPQPVRDVARRWRWADRARAWDAAQADQVEMRTRADQLAATARHYRDRYVTPVSRLSRPRRANAGRRFAAGIVNETAQTLADDAASLYTDAEQQET